MTDWKQAAAEGQSVRLTYGASTAVRGEGVLLAYTDYPQVCVRLTDGEEIWWRADRATILPDLLEDPDGAPYPQAVQDFISWWHPNEEARDRLVAILESVRGHDGQP